MLVGNNELAISKNAGDFDCHVDAVVQRRVDHPMEHIQGFTRSHGCRHRVSARIASQRWPPWSSITVENTKH